MLTVFLAALDQTIASVALPTIVADIGGETGYSWVGTAYLLSMIKLSSNKPSFFLMPLQCLLALVRYTASFLT